MDSKANQVYIAGGFDSLVAGMFLDAGWRGTRDLMMADIVVFTGGADIDPKLYGEPIAGAYGINTRRDEAEVELFKAAKNFGIPMLGICRGAQLLNVLNGGKLWQDVNHHTTNHWLTDLRNGTQALVTSTHHQQMIPNLKLGNLIAIAGKGERTSLCTTKHAAGVTQVPNIGDVDAEVVWYQDTQCLCFQPHPEYPGKTGTAEYFWSVFNELFDFDVDKTAQESAPSAV